MPLIDKFDTHLAVLKLLRPGKKVLGASKKWTRFLGQCGKSVIVFQGILTVTYGGQQPVYRPYLFNVSQHFFGRRRRLRFDPARLRAADTRAISSNCQGCHEEGRNLANTLIIDNPWTHGPLSRSTKFYLGCGSRCGNIIHWITRMPTRPAPLFNEDQMKNRTKPVATCCQGEVPCLRQHRRQRGLAGPRCCKCCLEPHKWGWRPCRTIKLIPLIQGVAMYKAHLYRWGT